MQQQKAKALQPDASRQSLRDLTTNTIRAAILSGQYRPGDRLIEDKLAAEAGVSRNPVRESLRALEAEGLVELKPRRGAFVATLTEDDVLELIELRASLEGLAAKLAARRGDAALVAQIDDLLARGDAAATEPNDNALAELNHEYHELLACAGANRHLMEVMQLLRAKTQWLFGSIMTARARDSWGEHANILRAMRDGDDELAGLLASRHVADVGRFYLARDRDSSELDVDAIGVLVPPVPTSARSRSR